MPIKKKKTDKNVIKNLTKGFIVPVIEDIHKVNPFTIESENIARAMVEKLISLSITTSHIKAIEEEIPNECINFTFKILNTLLRAQFLSYDHDENTIKKEPLPNFIETEIESIQQNSTIQEGESNIKKTDGDLVSLKFNLAETPFFDNYFHGDNNWNFPSEPFGTKVDRYASSMISYAPLEPELPKSAGGNSVIKEVNESKSLFNPGKTIDADKSDADLRSTFMKRTLRSKTGKSTVSSEKSKNVTKNGLFGIKEKPEKKKKMFEIMNELSYHDLPDSINKDKALDADIEELRKQKEDELKALETEKKKQLQKKKEQELKQEEEIQKKKEYSKKKITVDSNGKIVFIKALKLEQLAKQFLEIKSQPKKVMQKNTGPVKEDRPPRKNSVYYNREDSNNQVKVIENVSKKKTIFPTLVEKTTKQTDEKEDRELAQILRKKERGPVLPSGSCFDTISLEVGVNMVENSKSKTGGMDFFKKYQKYSMETYNKKLRDTASFNSLLTLNNFNSGYKSSANLMLNTENNFSSGRFPSIVNEMSPGRSSVFHQRNFSNYTERLHKTYHSKPLIKVNSSNHFSLRGTFDSLDLVRDKDLMGSEAHQSDIFKETMMNSTISSKLPSRKSKRQHPHLDEMNKFAVTIMDSSNWGKTIGGSSNKMRSFRLPAKPKLADLKKDFGVLNQKMPRERGAKSYVNLPLSTK